MWTWPPAVRSKLSTQQADTTTIDKFLIGTIKYLADGFPSDRIDLNPEYEFHVELYEALDTVAGVREKLMEVPMHPFRGMALLNRLVEVLSTLLRGTTFGEWKKYISE